MVKRLGNSRSVEDQIKKNKSQYKPLKRLRLGENGATHTGSTEVAMISRVYLWFCNLYVRVLFMVRLVMRGSAPKKKQNRIVEVIISSVKPVQLMMGKISALAAVGLTQFAIWVVLPAGNLVWEYRNLWFPMLLQTQKIMQTQSIMVPGANGKFITGDEPDRTQSGSTNNG